VTHIMQGCCCESISCPEFAECAPETVEFPCITVTAEYTATSSAGQLYRYYITMELRDVVMEFDASTNCYTSTEGFVDARYEFEACALPDAGPFNAAAGHCCPACNALCCGDSRTVEVLNQAIGPNLKVCCVFPCGGDAAPLLRMEFTGNYTGTFTDCDNAAANPGCCGAVVCDPPYTAGIDLGFRAWTNLSCDATTWFRCRTVDTYWGGHGGLWPSRILSNICGAGYQFENPSCTIEPDATVFNCAKTSFGVPFTHYQVCTCPAEICAGYYCVDRFVPLPVIYTQCCGCTIFHPRQLFCDAIGGASFPANDNGRVTNVVECDTMESTFCQPVVPP
jgi:hypothetical protein